MTALLLAACVAGKPGDLRAALDGTLPIPAARVNPDALLGYLHQPAYAVDKRWRPPLTPYAPAAGDLLLLSDPEPAYTLAYTLAFTGKPGHGALVVPLPAGGLGLFEAGWNGTTWTRVSPLEYRINAYPGTVWVRKRLCPPTPYQSARLEAFAQLAADRPYSMRQFALQLTPFRGRGPLRTFFVGRPVGPCREYFCAQALLEALVYAGLTDADTARPAATYPRDLFFDDSPNLFLKRHPPLAGGWQVPALWTRGGPEVAVPYTAFARPGTYQPPAGLVSPTPAKPNPR